MPKRKPTTPDRLRHVPTGDLCTVRVQLRVMGHNGDGRSVTARLVTDGVEANAPGLWWGELEVVGHEPAERRTDYSQGVEVDPLRE